jgi:hypothetical protein
MTTARRDLERSLSPAYQELLADRAKEAADEKAAADAAAAAALAADPVKQFEQVANIEAAQNREIVLNYKLSDQCLAVHGTVKRGPLVSAAEMRAMMWEFVQLTPSFTNTGNNVVMLASFVKRNELLNCVESYALAHKMLQHFACYPDDAEPAAPPPAAEEPVVYTDVLGQTWTESQIKALPPSERGVLTHEIYVRKIVGTDELGREWTDQAIDKELSADDGRRLRRLFETGTRGSVAYREYMRLKDIQQEQAAERDRIAAQDDREERL